MAKKIGRNDPCPCGSGKKFKKCCMNKPGEIGSKYQPTRTVHWSPEEIEAFSTGEIIRRLQNFGVDFKKEQFLQDVERFYSACDLADHWFEIYPITARGLDEDFIWMAAITLWKRLAPDAINSEQLDDMMQEGYELLEEGRAEKCCAIWLEVWEHLKRRFSPDMKSIEDAEQVFSGLQSLYNWCQNLEMELGNAGLEDASFYHKRIKYCQEFCRLFPETDNLTIKNMRRAEAESYFGLGEVEKGEQAFEAIVEEFPGWAWGYIGWGDMYWLFRRGDKAPLDYERAERIYRMALAKNVDDKEDVLDRLEELEKEKGKQE